MTAISEQDRYNEGYSPFVQELSLASSDCSSATGVGAQHAKQKCEDGSKLAKICMVSQQSETKTVVVEVHRSEEPDDSVATTKSTFTSERLTADEVRDKISQSWHAATNTVQYLEMFISW
jgi:hypothetical protein